MKLECIYAKRKKSEKEKYFMVKQVESKKKIKLIENRMGVAEGWEMRGKGEILVKGYRLS